jgi:hypothetical protein
MTMYAFLFVLVPLAIVAAWALAHDRKPRYWRHARVGRPSRIRAARQSAEERAAKWMVPVAQDEQGDVDHAGKEGYSDRPVEVQADDC